MIGVKTLFEPKSVVLFGSSKIYEKVGMTSPRMFESVIYNMNKYFKGDIQIVDLAGIKGAKSTGKLRNTPDLGVVILPPSASIKQVENGARNGVKVFVLLTGGYSNQQREQLADLKRHYDIRIQGPNSVMGIINTSNGLNTTFDRDLMPAKGVISVISQSGGVGACLLDLASTNGIGLSKIAFMGDKVDIDDVDILQYFDKDPKTKVICLYIEGIERGKKFIETARNIVKKKPILVLKGGKTREVARRALSHTASITGSNEVFDAAFKKAGIIRVQGIAELLNAAIALAKQPSLRGDNVAIVSNVGGPAILAADAIVSFGLKLATISQETKKIIEKHYPGLEATNPIDLIADARKERYTFVLDNVLSDPNVDGILVINMLKSSYFEPEDALAVAETSKKYPEKTIVDVALGGKDFSLVQRVLMNSNVPVYNLPEKAAKIMEILREYNKTIEKMR